MTSTGALPFPADAIGTASPSRTWPGLTVFGCRPDEAALFRERAPRVGVHPLVTTAAPISEDTASLASGMRCVSVDHRSRVTNPTLLALSGAGVRRLSTRSVGHDHIDRDYAAAVGIGVHTVAYSPHGVADHTLMQILMLLRDVRSTIRRVDAGDYRLGPTGRELRDLTVGVVGTGRIGAAVAERLRGFGADVLAHDRRPTDAMEHVSLDELLRRSDIVTLHLPLTATTRHLLDRERITAMKTGALLVNTARGALIDTPALVDALESGRLGGAALDVIEGEEGIFSTDRRHSPAENAELVRLRALPTALITPHTAFHTDHALRDIVDGTLALCARGDEERQDA